MNNGDVDLLLISIYKTNSQDQIIYLSPVIDRRWYFTSLLNHDHIDITEQMYIGTLKSDFVAILNKQGGDKLALVRATTWGYLKQILHTSLCFHISYLQLLSRV